MSKIVDIEKLGCLIWKDGEHGTTFDDGVLWVLEKIDELSAVQTCEDAVSRQAAIDAVSRGCQEFRGIFAECEKNLNALPSAQPDAPDTNGGDIIYRQAAIDLIENYCENGCDLAEDNWCPSCQREQFVKLLKDLPSLQPEQKKGKWINAYPNIEPNPMFMYGICSVCGFEQSISDKLNFCPNCGAKMEGSEWVTK